MSADKHIYTTSSGRASTLLGGVSTRSLYQGKVIEILDGHRLRVRLEGLDNRYKDADLPICSPLLSLYLKMNPEVGEVVDVLLCDTATPYDDRRWIGPTVTQYTYLGGQKYVPSIVTVNRDGFFRMNEVPDPSAQSSAQGVFSDTQNSSEQVWSGRGGTDITQTPDQVRLRAGKKTKAVSPTKNNTNPATLVVHESSDGKQTAIAAVADKFYFLGHNGDRPLTETKLGEISDDILAKMEATSHPGTLTNYLIEALNLMRQVLLSHGHPYDGQPALNDALMKKLSELDFTQIASKTVRLN